MSLSAKEIIDAVDGMSAGDKQKVFRHLVSAQGCTGDRVLPPTEQPSGASKKAVNGFMAFRSFYSALFPGLQQKERSGFLTTLWDADLYRAEWEFMAKIYSYVRDEAERNNPSTQLSMREFLEVSCPLMNLVGVDNYLATFNWQMVPNGDGHYDLKQYSLPLVQKATPTMTGFDLLYNCLSNGYHVANGQEILFRMTGKPENMMTTASFVTFQIPAPIPSPNPRISPRNDFLEAVSQNPFLATSMVMQGGVSHSPDVHGVNVFRVHDINKVPDEVLRNRGSSSGYRQNPMDGLSHRYDSPAAVELEFGEHVMRMESAENHNSSDMTPSAATTPAFGVDAALGPNFLQSSNGNDMY